MLKFMILLLSLTVTAWANEYLETASFTSVAGKVQELRAKYSAREVLIVLDIDNTLLKTKQILGSDQWFEWQNDAIKNGLGDAAFKNFEELLMAQANFYQLSSMSLTEQVIPEVVNSFARSGHQMILLTSRSPDLRNVTERELKRNHLWFSQTSIMNGIPQDFLEMPFKNPVSFMNGIFMTSGHHKGEALNYILSKAGKRYKAIIFVDDHERHTRRVFDSFSTRGDVEIVTYRYGKEDPRVREFKEGPKGLVQSQTRDFHQIVNRIFK